MPAQYVDLKLFRKVNKMTQIALANYLGVGQGSISQIENNARPLPEEHISKLLSDPDLDTSMLKFSSESSPGLTGPYNENIISKFADAIESIAKSNSTMSETNKILAATNAELVEQIRSLLRSYDKPSDKRHYPAVENKPSVASDTKTPHKP